LSSSGLHAKRGRLDFIRAAISTESAQVEAAAKTAQEASLKAAAKVAEAKAPEAEVEARAAHEAAEVAAEEAAEGKVAKAIAEKNAADMNDKAYLASLDAAQAALAEDIKGNGKK
jgi:hypothetical protein